MEIVNIVEQMTIEEQLIVCTAMRDYIDLFTILNTVL